MEPFVRDRVSLLRPPGVVGLSPSEDESPADCPDAFVLEDWQMGDKPGVQGPGHILRADNGPVVLLIDGRVLLSLLMLVMVHSTSQ